MSVLAPQGSVGNPGGPAAPDTVAVIALDPKRRRPRANAAGKHCCCHHSWVREEDPDCPLHEYFARQLLLNDGNRIPNDSIPGWK